MKRVVCLGLFLGLCVLCGRVEAQVGSCVPRDWLANVAGTAKACITVSNAAVVVLAANDNRCGAYIHNNSANTMTCTESRDGDPTTTAGIPIVGQAVLAMGQESRRAIKCIRTGASDAVACVAEWLP